MPGKCQQDPPLSCPCWLAMHSCGSACGLTCGRYWDEAHYICIMWTRLVRAGWVGVVGGGVGGEPNKTG
jgi:hypothetical protein